MTTAASSPKLFTVETQHGERKIVDVDKIDIPGRAGFDENVVASLADNIKRVGLIHPPTVLASKGGKFVALTGRRRCAALQMLAATEAAEIAEQQKAQPDRVFARSFETVEVVVRSKSTTSDADIAALILSENAQRSENVLAELESINVLIEAGSDAKTIAKSTGQNISWIRHRTVLNKLDARLMVHFRAGRIRFETAQQIARLDAEQQSRVVDVFETKLEADDDAILAMRDVDVTKSRPAVALLPAQMFGSFPQQPAVMTDCAVLTERLVEPTSFAPATTDRVEPMSPIDRLRIMRTELDELRPLMRSMSSREALTRARSRVNVVIEELEELKGAK